MVVGIAVTRRFGRLVHAFGGSVRMSLRSLVAWRLLISCLLRLTPADGDF
jgi:hypothetical protein